MSTDATLSAAGPPADRPDAQPGDHHDAQPPHRPEARPSQRSGLPLPSRPLGATGESISVLGLGAWAIGGGGWSFCWGPQDDEVSLATMRHAVELGITWIDTAGVYGCGHSEEVVGRFLAGLPAADRPLVFTKGGLSWDVADRMAKPVRDSRPAVIRTQCEDSLRRLGVERLDLYQFHWPDETGVPVEESWGEMARLVEEGKVRWAGISNYGVGLLERCEAVRHVDTIQPHLSLIERDAAADLLPWAREHGAGVICYSPMESGQLTDTFSRERREALDDDDWRRRVPPFADAALTKNLALRDGLRPIAERHGSTTAAVAVAWVLAWDGVSGAIVGARSPEQIDGWIDAATLHLTDEDLDEIAAAVRAGGAGSGPERPA